MYLYAGNMGFTFWNFVETVGAFILAVGVLLFLVNVAITARKPRNAPLDPWDARSYEWMTTSPPKPHNFDAIPTVHTIDEFFHRKYAEDDDGNLQQVLTAEEIIADQERNADKHIHLPSPSYWPLLVAAGLPIIGIGLIFSYPVAAVGLVVALGGCYGWALEPSVAEDSPDDAPGAHKELSTVG
jgi:cytochrome c oxidase subunit 1